MTIPSRACAPLISVIQATTMAAVIQTAAGILPVLVMETILAQDRDRALVQALMADLDLTAAAAMTIITVANLLSSSELVPVAIMIRGDRARRYS